MIDINGTIKNLIGMQVNEDEKEFRNDVICKVDTDSDLEIIVSKDESNKGIDFQVYENSSDSPIICFKIEDGEITEAWEA